MHVSNLSNSRVITEIAQCTRLRRKPGQTTPTQVFPPLSTSPVTHSSSVAIPLDNSPVGAFWSPGVLESHSMIRFLAFCRWSDLTNSCQHHTYTELVLGLHVGLTRPGLPWPHREGAKLLPCPSQASCYCVNSPGSGALLASVNMVSLVRAFLQCKASVPLSSFIFRSLADQAVLYSMWTGGAIFLSLCNSRSRFQFYLVIAFLIAIAGASRVDNFVIEAHSIYPMWLAVLDRFFCTMH